MQLNESKKKPREWKAGKGWKGSTKAALDHHPDKFSKEACKTGYKGDKLCPYAIMQAMKKKGYDSHYKDQPSTLKGKPKKKKTFKEWLNDVHPNFPIAER